MPSREFHSSDRRKKNQESARRSPEGSLESFKITTQAHIGTATQKMQKTNELVEEKIARIEEEIRLFEDFAKSPIWALLRSQWQPIVDTAIGAALSGSVPDRGFAAGRANGLKHFLKYPEKHIQTLNTQLKQYRAQVKA